MEGKTNQGTNEFAEAILEYSISADYLPNAITFNNIGECYLQMGQIDSAIKYFHVAIKTDSTFVPAYLILTDLYDNRNEKQKAIDIATELLKYENTEEVKLRIAYLYQEIDINKTIEIVTACLNEGNNHELYLYLMDIYRYLKDEPKFKYYEEKYLLSPNKKLESVNKLIEANIADNQLDNSLRYLDTIKANSSEKAYNSLLSAFYPYSIFNHSFDLLAVHKLMNAIESSTLEANFRNVFMGNLFLQKSDSISARELYNKSAGASSNNLLFSVLANINHNYPEYAMKLSRQYQDSLIFYSPEQFKVLTQLFYHNKEYALMSNFYKKEYYRDPTRRYLLVSIGDAYSVQNKQDSAVKYYAMAVDYFPDDANLLNNYAYFLAITKGDLNLALKCADKAIKKMPENPNILDTYGWIQYLLGNNKEAEKYIRAALKLLPNAKEAYIHLSYVLLAKGDVKASIIQWIKAMTIDAQDGKKQS